MTILQDIAVHPGFVFFCKLLKEEAENEVKRKILNNEEISQTLYARVQMAETLHKKPLCFVEKIQKHTAKRETDPY